MTPETATPLSGVAYRLAIAVTVLVLTCGWFWLSALVA